MRLPYSSAAGVMAQMLLVATGLVACAEPTISPQQVSTQVSATAETPEEGPDPEQEYLSYLEVDLDEAIQRAAFDLKLPDHPAASRANIVTVLIQPDGEAVIVRFPEPLPPQSPVRVPYLEIYEARWTGGDPAETYMRDIEGSPAVGEKMLDVAGLPALGQEAHSPTDETGENPAFLKFVSSEVEIRIHGGESLDLLLEVAESIVGEDQSR